MTNNISAIVLAGGKSSRMGRDKALIPIQGIPMLQRIFNIAKNCVDPVYIVTPWPEHYQHLLLPGCEFIQEIPKFNVQCPLTGFAQGLEKVTTEWVLLLACDLPNLKIEILQDWVKRLENVERDAIAILPQSIKGWETLCGFYRCSSLPLLLDFISQGGTSFQKWLSQHSVAVLPLSEPEMLFNCNTPDDLALTQEK
ncbi:MAG TPA: molybdenum cofactor guanylyltransferase [Nostocaceae cyanobacterium]|nr:molybdenum cofactor guanylyltransferase [Nostocaceae cyanobacterium]